MIEGLLAVLACGLQLAGQLRRHAPQVARALASEGLASGVATASALREIGARADEYYRDVLERVTESTGGERVMLDVPRLADHIARPPRWADGFFSFAESLGARPEAATDLLRYAELKLFESFAGRDPQPALRAFVRGDHSWLAGALASAAGFCHRYWSIEDPLLERLRPTGGTGGGGRHDGGGTARAVKPGTAAPSAVVRNGDAHASGTPSPTPSVQDGPGGQASLLDGGAALGRGDAGQQPPNAEPAGERKTER